MISATSSNFVPSFSLLFVVLHVNGFSSSVVITLTATCCLLLVIMRPERNALDLNNLPEEYGRQIVEESPTTTAASTGTTGPKKKIEGKYVAAKAYECRFCSLKFCKSQALGGHMNRHRQERETETLNRARQLLFSTEGLAAAGVQMRLRNFSIGCSQPIFPGGFQLHRGDDISGDPRLQLRPAQPSHASPNVQPFTCSSTTSHSNAFASPYQLPVAPRVSEFFIGPVLKEDGSQSQPPINNASFTCFGAPLTAGAMKMGGVRGPADATGPAVAGNQTAEYAMNWGCSYGQG